MSAVISQTDFAGLNLRARGKVRDIYELGDQLLIVATDRLAAFDVVLPTPIPDKGRVLTQLSLFWFEKLASIVPNHVISADNFAGVLAPYADALQGRAMLVRRTEPVPIECVVRGYLSGSGWKDYQKTGAVCGIALPAGLRESDALPEPIFTPATKAQTGHDENISFERMVSIVGEELSTRLRDLTLKIYQQAVDYARPRGIILADTKFEFGMINGVMTLADEVLTPDSSRFWPVDTYKAGGPQPSYDKQYVRDYLESIHWNKQPPPPALPDEVARRTSEKYQDAYRALSGRALNSASA